jgi:hypothetical protein
LFFPDIVYNNGYSLVCTGKRKEGQQSMIQAVTIFAAMNEESRIAELKKDIDKSFGSGFLSISDRIS